MTITEDTHGSIHLLILDGRLDASTCEPLAMRLGGLVQSGVARVLLDCERLAFVNSVGLRALLVGAKKTKAAGGVLACCGLQPMVAEVFGLSGFSSVLAIHPDRAAAIQALG